MPTATLEALVAALVDSLRAAVPSYCGLTLQVGELGRTVEIRLRDPLGSMPIATSLELRISSKSPYPPNLMTVYATEAGALAHLAAEASRSPATSWASTRIAHRDSNTLTEAADGVLRSAAAAAGAGAAAAAAADEVG